MPDADAPPPALGAHEGLYLYAVAPPTLGAFAHEGMAEGGAVTAWRCAGFAAVVEALPVADWTGTTGAANLEKLEWVAPRAVHHERVIRAAMDAAEAVYPARFGTLFSAPAELAATLAEHADAVRGFLDRMAGAEEWGVKGLLDRAAAERHLAETSAPADRPASGADYLRRRKQAQQAKRDVAAWASHTGEAILDALAAHALDTRPLTPRPDPSQDAEVVFSAAFLLSTGGALEAFRSDAERLHEAHAEAGLSLRVTGPWPPYSFRPSLGE